MEDTIFAYATMKFLSYEEKKEGEYNGYAYPRRYRICCSVRGKTSIIKVYFKATYSDILKSKLEKMKPGERYEFRLYLEPVLEKGKIYSQSAKWEINDIILEGTDSVK